VKEKKIFFSLLFFAFFCFFLLFLKNEF